MRLRPELRRLEDRLAPAALYLADPWAYTDLGGGRVSLATGLRYKFTEHFQLGTAFEWPLTSRKDLTDFRFTFDLIFRY